MHVIKVNRRLDTPEDGLLIGNGELSVSIYQRENDVVFRLGKPDVWDRRIDRSCDPNPPPHIDEIAKGLSLEGWVCPSVAADGDTIYALNGSADEARMRTICIGSPDSYERRPTPCPKPTGELTMHLPPDIGDFTVRQALYIEDNRVEIRYARPNGMAFHIACFVAPEPDALGVEWRVENAPEDWSYGRDRTVWFTLHRWRDPSAAEFVEGQQLRYGVGLVPGRMSRQTAIGPLPLPTVRRHEGLLCVEQAFPADLTFPDGFVCVMAPYAADCDIREAPLCLTGASVELMPRGDARWRGRAMVGVTTSSNTRSAAEAAVENIGCLERFEALKAECVTRSRAFFAASSLRCADRLIEDAWYEQLHARRCVQLNKTVAPGLFFPSSLADYTHWHGDYHTNYNIQQPYWGSFSANHSELVDGWLRTMPYLMDVGRLIASKYYNCRGAFMQLTNYPMILDDDPFGIAPLGRMAYMTGWMASMYYERYLYTMDLAFLRDVAYPAIRELALFYLDFMREGDDGRYHIFPSGQGEDGFDGTPRAYTDRAQVLAYACYCLRCAADAAGTLGADEELRVAWLDRLARCAGDEGRSLCEPRATGSPEYRGVQSGMEPRPTDEPWPPMDSEMRKWYMGHYIYESISRIRTGLFGKGEYEVLRQNILRWRRPNGLIQAMSAQNYGRLGAWSEGVGLLGSFQEMLLRPGDGPIRLFPGLPAEVDVAFEGFRTQGGFLLSARRAGGRVTRFEVTSEAGGAFVFVNPYPGAASAVDERGRAIPFQPEGEALCLETRPGGRYRIRPMKAPQ